jgi:hypothetical protein
MLFLIFLDEKLRNWRIFTGCNYPGKLDFQWEFCGRDEWILVVVGRRTYKFQFID